MSFRIIILLLGISYSCSSCSLLALVLTHTLPNFPVLTSHKYTIIFQYSYHTLHGILYLPTTHSSFSQVRKPIFTLTISSSHEYVALLSPYSSRYSVLLLWYLAPYCLLSYFPSCSPTLPSYSHSFTLLLSTFPLALSLSYFPSCSPVLTLSYSFILLSLLFSSYHPLTLIHSSAHPPTSLLLLSYILSLSAFPLARDAFCRRARRTSSGGTPRTISRWRDRNGYSCVASVTCPNSCPHNVWARPATTNTPVSCPQRLTHT